VTVNNKLIFSKLKSHRFPSFDKVRHLNPPKKKQQFISILMILFF